MSKASQASKAASQISKRSSVKAPSIHSRKSKLAEAGLKSIAGDKLDSVSVAASSSIRTTTTTRERMEAIERQLEEETAKRVAAELAIVQLTKGHL